MLAWEDGEGWVKGASMSMSSTPGFTARHKCAGIARRGERNQKRGSKCTRILILNGDVVAAGTKCCTGQLVSV